MVQGLVHLAKIVYNFGWRNGRPPITRSLPLSKEHFAPRPNSNIVYGFLPSNLTNKPANYIYIYN